MSGQQVSENKGCPPFAEVMVKYFNDSLEVSFDIIQHMIHDNLTILNKISEERNEDWIADVQEELGRADEICYIVLDILSYETLPTLIKESDIKKYGGDLQDAVQDLWYVHEKLKELQKEYDEDLAKKVVESAVGARRKLESMLLTMIGSIAVSTTELEKYGYVQR